jgi:TM2 domain-containing membrane protein YozV
MNDIHMMAMSLPEEKRQKFFMYANSLELKDSTTAVLLALFLGGFGGHQFYMGRTGLGVVYILLCWTFLPAICGFFEAFAMPSRVREYNQKQLNQALALVS